MDRAPFLALSKTKTFEFGIGEFHGFTVKSFMYCLLFFAYQSVQSPKCSLCVLVYIFPSLHVKLKVTAGIGREILIRYLVCKTLRALSSIYFITGACVVAILQNN